MLSVNTLPALPDPPAIPQRAQSPLALLLNTLQAEGGARPPDRSNTSPAPQPGGALVAALKQADIVGPGLTTAAQSAATQASAPRLSEAAKLLAQLGMRPRSPLELMLGFNSNEMSPGADPMQPITAAATLQPPLADMAPRELAHLLRSVITRSGLFYESHLHDWVQGQRPLTDLGDEPQMRQHRNGNAEHFPTGVPAAATHATTQAAEPALPPAGPSTPAMQQTVPIVPTVPTVLQDIVSQQLDVLDSRQLHLHLVTGTDQPVDLMIGQEHADVGNPQASGVWVTHLDCHLTELGDVHIELRLQGGHLRVDILAEDATRSDWLDARLSELRGMLAHSGLHAPNLGVRHQS